MLGFTLSKFSLLILVVSMLGIVSFFTFHLTDSLKVKSLNDLLNHNSTIASEMLSSPSFCDILLVKIPETVRLSTSEMYYVMKINYLRGDSGKSYLIFSAADRSNPERILASSSSPTTANVIFYNKDSASGAFVQSPDDGTGITLDPSARSDVLTDAFYLVKEINPTTGNVELYVFPCAISGGMSSVCEDVKYAVGALVHPASSGGIGRFECTEQRSS